MSPSDLNFILESAILAPSADNHHPIRFLVDGERIFVYYIGPRLAKVGYRRVLALLSLGAVAENLAIAASHLNRDATIQHFPDPTHPDLALLVTLHPREAVEDPLWSVIPRRHTNRRVFFHGPCLNQQEKHSLEEAVSSYPGCRLHWLDEPTVRWRALAIMYRAETERFRNPLLHEELFSAIRFEVGWKAATEEGLPPGALGVEPPLRPFFALLRHWPVMRIAKLVGAHYLLGGRACYLPCILAPNLAVLSVKDYDTPSLIFAGRAWQRIWLGITRLGRVLQPFPASALYAMEGAEAEGIPKELRRSLAEAWTHLLPSDELPTGVFRIGFARPHPVHTRRRPLAHYISV